MTDSLVLHGLQLQRSGAGAVEAIDRLQHSVTVYDRRMLCLKVFLHPLCGSVFAAALLLWNVERDTLKPPPRIDVMDCGF